MRKVLIVVVLVVAAACLGLWRTNGGVRQGLSRAVGMPADNSEGVTSDETRKSFELKSGDRVSVQGINGHSRHSNLRYQDGRGFREAHCGQPQLSPPAGNYYRTDE